MFNMVFDIFDQLSANDKQFFSGDYSSADNYEELVGKLRKSVDHIEKSLMREKTDETSHLMSYLIKMIDNEEAKLRDLIIRLENTDVSLYSF